MSEARARDDSWIAQWLEHWCTKPKVPASIPVYRFETNTSSPERDLNFNLPVLDSLAQQETGASASYATEACQIQNQERTSLAAPTIQDESDKAIRSMGDARVVGGRDAVPGELPYIVSSRFKDCLKKRLLRLQFNTFSRGMTPASPAVLGVYSIPPGPNGLQLLEKNPVGALDTFLSEL
uniref:Uncharacterized protein n=1 Tax=Timema bartmani TaxID=61472 RepID=A0A7R9EU14_9NEOP|nr:unnamed protein product [Timema bartmani]